MRASILILLIAFHMDIMCQTWYDMMKDPSVNFYQVQKEFNKYLLKQKRKQRRAVKRGQAYEEEIPGYTMYKRWEWFMEPRVFPDGDRTSLYLAGEKNLVFNTTARQNPDVQQSGNWTLLGPVNTIPSNGGGSGRLNVVRIDPTNPNVIYVGAPAGGMWKSVNGGLTWNTSTDQLASIGVSEVVIDYTNPAIVYIGTGDNDAGDTYSCGVLKSQDGGQTWSMTGLSFNTTQSSRITRMLMHPVNPLILYAGTNNGIYKTTDGGVSWYKIFSSGVKDMEFKPGDPNTIYMATASAFYKSSNGGVNFYLVSGGLPGSGSTSRLAIAVTPADPNYVYVLASRNSNNGFMGLYLSTNSGNSFSIQSSSPNVLGWAPSGNDTDGQGWYTLSIDASPVNRDEIIVGGVNIWRSTDAGNTWTLNAHWYGGGGAPYVHADIHDLRYVNGTSFYVASDGGLAFTSNSGGSFTDLSAGLQIAQMYRLGTAATNANITVTGWQDNGTNLYSSGSWGQIYGGDGMECFVDWSTDQVMYCETQYGGFQISTDGGNSFMGIGGFTNEAAPWVTPWCQDPSVPGTIYAGLNNVWKSTDQGASWNAISNFGPLGITVLKLAPSNNQIIWAGSQNVLYKTTNGGFTWSVVNLPFMAFLNSVAIDAGNPNNVWVCFGGYFGGQKVYKSADGGTTWTNITGTGLPNVNCNTIVHQTGTSGGVYVGTDVGVFYYDDLIQNWSYFSNGLPNVIVDELEIHYGSGKLRAATYGRGLWETSLYNPASTAPLANFTANDLAGCPGFSVQFTDMSTNSPTSWNWSFPGGIPSVSNQQNPVVVYNTPGSYNNVKLVASNANGSDSLTRYSYIAVSPLSIPTIMLTNDDTVCDNQPLLLISSAGASYLWSPNNQVSHMISPAASGTYAVTVTDMFGCSATSAPVDITILPFPSSVITQNGDTFCSSPAVMYQWYLNGSPVNGANQQCYVVQAPGNYYVVVSDSNGCTGTSNTLIGIAEPGDVFPAQIFPNPASTGFILAGFMPGSCTGVLRILDIVGREVYNSGQNDLNAQFVIQTDVSVFHSGAYQVVLETPFGVISKALIIKK
ncbi:MAG: PKD domain-containing protein [Bacteroidia bacterium]|nr:PKD domain-containing protein [Bacteroidia bacterium]